MSNKVPLQSVPSCPEFFRRDNPWKAPVVPLLKVNGPDTRHPAGVTLRDLERLTGRHRDTYGRDTNRRHAGLVGLGISYDDLGGCRCVRMHEYCHSRVFSANITLECAKPWRDLALPNLQMPCLFWAEASQNMRRKDSVDGSYTRSILTSSISKIRVLWAGMPSSFIEP